MTESARNRRVSQTIALLRVSGIGRGRLRRLVQAFGSIDRAVTAPISALATVPGISQALASAIKAEYDETAAQDIARQIETLGWEVLLPGDGAYPEPLAQVDQAPPILFRIGQPWRETDRMIAIVGTRHPTEHGKRFAYSLARGLAEAGVVIVSGMAEGIDTAAHAGALDGGGRTVAVWGNSLDIVYPPTNRELAERVRENGAVYSEYFPETGPDRPHFPERNRIIAGLSAGTVVVEAGHKSGALITAEHALEQGRAVFAVPGAPGAPMSQGANELLKQGATLVTSVDDIFRDLPTLKGEVRAGRVMELPDLTDDERRLVALFASGPVQIDQLSRDTQLSIPELSQFLLALELKGVVQELSGKRFILTETYAC